MWSVGCIFAELLLKEPLFQAKGEIELLSMIFKLLGPPTSQSWPGYSSLPLAKTITLPSPQPHQFRQKFQYIMTAAGVDLLMAMLTYDPEMRISAEEALQHPYFRFVLYSFDGEDRLRCTDNTMLASRHCQSIPTCLDPSHLLLPARSTSFVHFASDIANILYCPDARNRLIVHLPP